MKVLIVMNIGILLGIFLILFFFVLRVFGFGLMFFYLFKVVFVVKNMKVEIVIM